MTFQETLSGVGEIRDQTGTIASVRYRMFVEADVLSSEPQLDVTESGWTLRSGEFVVLSGRVPHAHPTRTFVLLPKDGDEFTVVIEAEDHVSGRYKVAPPIAFENAS